MKIMDPDTIDKHGQAIAETIKQELRTMMKLDEKTILISLSLQDRVYRHKNIHSFADLHDIMDANVLGNSEDVFDIAAQEMGMVTIEERDCPEFTEGWCRIANAAQDEVDHWIRNGGLTNDNN